MKVVQSYPMDYSLPSSSVHGILQAVLLEWVAVPFSRGSNPGFLHCRRVFLPFEPPGNPCNAKATLNVGNNKGGRQASSRKSLPHVPKLINTPATLCWAIILITWLRSQSSTQGCLEAKWA